MYGKNSIIYSNVWEDPELNRKSLNINNKDIVLSITSGGCNSLNLLLENPAKLVSIDCNYAQLYLLGLKIAAFKKLTIQEIWDLLGVKVWGKGERVSGDERLVLYGKIRDDLSNEERVFWDKNLHHIKKGIIFCGAVENFFSIYRNIVDKFYAVGGAKSLFFCKSMDEQRKKFKTTIRAPVRLLNHLLLNKFVLGFVKGRQSFKYVNNLNFGENFNSKLRYAFTNTFLYENYFLALILLGCYTSYDCLPPYLLEKNFETMKKNINKIEYRYGTLKEILGIYGPQSFTKFNMSNIFEWFDEVSFNDVFSQLFALAKPDSRVCFRYTLARPQKLDETNSKHFVAEEDLAQELFSQDRAFMYESFHVYHVKK